MVNASLRSYVVHHDQSGLSRQFLRGTGIMTTQYIYKYVINANKAINELKTKIFQRVQCLWDYMVVKASLRSHSPPRPIRIITPKSQREKWGIFTI
jgi:hypothetical protein